MENLQVLLRRRPLGAPVADDFELVASERPTAGPGELLIRVQYLSVDPALRPRMEAVSDYAGAVPIGELIPSAALGVVVESGSPRYSPGDHVFGFFGWQTYCVVDACSVRAIDPALAPLPKWMSLLGLSSFTAWIGMTRIGRPEPGETVVVSAASGATGSVAGQLARIAGARVVGIAGGPEKCAYAVEELGFDACVDYRTSDFEAQLDAACPNGIDVDYENVGGSIFRSVFSRMNDAGRIVLCGMVSEYSNGQWMDGPSLWPAVHRSLRIEGFRASTHFWRIPEFVGIALGLAAQGRLRQHECITDGIDNAPAAFVAMLEGRHLGKAMVRIAAEC